MHKTYYSRHTTDYIIFSLRFRAISHRRAENPVVLSFRSRRSRDLLEQPLRRRRRGWQPRGRGRGPRGRRRRCRRVRACSIFRGRRGRAANRRHASRTEGTGRPSRSCHLAERAASAATINPGCRTDGAGPGRGEAGTGHHDACRSTERPRRGSLRVAQKRRRHAGHGSASRPNPRARGRDARATLQVSHLHGKLIKLICTKMNKMIVSEF